ncbi:single-stranded DNA-binding protein [Erysipelothrix rhusiopathiae]|nr:single-stranded DNA-binding protein [Erysipelothrix rhusiopathiae]
MNFVQLVGHIETMPVPIEDHSNESYALMHLSVTSNFRTPTGIFRKDTFPILLWRGASETTTNSCKPGSLISVKGRLEINDEKFILIAEHLEFLYPK